MTLQVKIIKGDQLTIPLDNKIVVMTYAKFGVLAEKFPRFGYDFELILCDEIHSL